MVAAQGLILLAFTNVINRAPTVAPFGGAQACMTTNPLCFAGPLPGGRPPFIVDMATSSIAVNKARVLAAKGEQAPPGSLIDAQGNPTTDPNALFADPPGALLPFGGHKGYAMGLVAELLAGVLSGGGTIQPEHPRNGVATNNMFAILLNPQVDFNTDWRSLEVGAFIDYLHASPAATRRGPGAVSRRVRSRQPCAERGFADLRCAYLGRHEAAGDGSGRGGRVASIAHSFQSWRALQEAPFHFGRG